MSVPSDDSRGAGEPGAVPAGAAEGGAAGGVAGAGPAAVAASSAHAAGNGANGGTAVLEVEDIHTYYGAIQALKGVSLTVNEGEIVTLIGSNGAGKSTTLRSISGIAPPRLGAIRFRGRDITGLPGHQVAELGISQSPEGRRVFPRMSVLENLEMGAFTRNDEQIRADIDRVYELFPRLKEREKQKAGTMSGGEQQMLAIGRALMANPKLLLLDEPSLGLAPVIVDRIYEIIREINHRGVTILLVEQNANYALDVSNRGYVLETGRVVLSNASAELRHDPEVMKAYLGT
jgi:branched-chain amino acid transport system ATP-binding protein